MSRGLSEIQKTILGLLEGTEKGRVYKINREAITREIADELLERGLLNESAPRKQLSFTVIRACASLVRRGLVEGTYEPDCDNPGRTTVTWRASSKGLKKEK